MSTKLVIYCKPDRMSAKVQHFFARDLDGKRCDEYPYHAGFITDDGSLYDMAANLRKTEARHYDDRTRYVFTLPVEVEQAFLDSMVGRIGYGYGDVVFFPLLQSIGVNWFGTHCTEFVNDVLWWNGMRTYFFPLEAPPSPCALLRWAITHLPFEALSANHASGG